VSQLTAENAELTATLASFESDRQTLEAEQTAGAESLLEMEAQLGEYEGQVAELQATIDLQKPAIAELRLRNSQFEASEGERLMNSLRRAWTVRRPKSRPILTSYKRR